MSVEHTGSCLCGAVRLRVTGPLRNAVACHCSQCRKQSGHYWAATNALEADVAIEGADNVTWFQSSQEARRGFCRTCGSVMFWKWEGSDTVSIGAGLFDTAGGFRLDQHIFCADKGDYYEIADDLPHYPAGAPDIVTAG